MNRTIRRGDIWLVDFDPAQGTEVTKTRPAIVVSTNASNRVTSALGRGQVVVVPMTSNVSKVFDFQLLVDKTEANGLSTASKAQCEQIRSVSITQFQRQLGTLSQGQTLALNDRLRLHLGV